MAVGEGVQSTRAEVQGVSASFFSFFDARPALGRFFTAAEDVVPQGSAVVVLSYGWWQTYFGGNPDVIGRQLRIGPKPFEIIGVAPAGFAGVDADNTRAWRVRPLEANADKYDECLACQ